MVKFRLRVRLKCVVNVRDRIKIMVRVKLNVGLELR